MRPWLIIALIAVVALGLGYVHPFGNPRLDPPKGRSTLLKGTNLPADAKAVLVAKCADCHSSETQWPVYARIAPGSWLIERDIIQGRKHMDLSQWEAMPSEKQQVLASQIIQQAKKGDMPPPQYLLLHWNAKLTKADLQTLSLLDKIPVVSEATLTGGGNAVHGRVVFEKRCASCHAMDVDIDGPRLAGVYGRKAGSVAGYTYSAGLKKLGVRWNDATLEKWLSDPDVMVPDNNMSFRVPKAEERRDLIAYLKQ